MLGAVVVHWVLGEVDGKDVVAVDDCRHVDWNVELAEKMTKPAALRSDICRASVLFLGTGS